MKSTMTAVNRYCRHLLVDDISCLDVFAKGHLPIFIQFLGLCADAYSLKEFMTVKNME